MKIYNNTAINKLLKDKKITHEEYILLFEEKDIATWKKHKVFNILLQQIIRFQKYEEILNLSYIKFSNFNYFTFNYHNNQNISFSNTSFSGFTIFMDATFSGDVNFNNTSFSDLAHFMHASFLGSADFRNTSFKYGADFSDATFSNKANFDKSSFLSWSDFRDASFLDEAYFTDASFSGTTYFQNVLFSGIADFRAVNTTKLINFSDISFLTIDIEDSDFSRTSYLRMHTKKNDKSLPLSVANFRNKESARLIKAHFEKQNNIAESNKYFKIEQELYLKELKKSNYIEHQTATKFVLYLNKFISDFGTDWIRTLFVMFSFGFITSFFYLFLLEKPTLLSNTNNTLLWLGIGLSTSIVLYSSYHRKLWWVLGITFTSYIILIFMIPDLRLISNDISKLVNPLNIFKTKDYFEDIAPYGMFVKLIMATLIYQFIIAFRQNTRRK